MVTTSLRQSTAITTVLRDVVQYVPSTILPTIFAMGAVYVYTREFTAAQYGVYNLWISIVTPMTLLLTEWAAQPIGRYYAEYDAQAKLDVYRRGVVTLMAMIIAVVLLLSFVLSGVLIGRSSFHLVMYLAIVVCVMTQCSFVLTSRILPSSMRADRYRKIALWVSILSIGISLAFIRLFGKNIVWLFWGQALANLCLLPFLFRWNKLSVRSLELFRFTPEFKAMFRQFYAYGVPMLIWFLSNNLLDDEDRWIIQWFHGSAEVGVYSVNYNLISAVGNFMSVPVVSAIGPILYRQWSLRHYDDAQNTISAMTEIYCILAAMVLGGTMVVGTSVVHLFLGLSFWPGASILIPVLIGRIFWGAASIGHRTLELSERTLTMGISGVAAAGLNLILNLIFVPHFGYQAAALSTAVSYCGYAVIIQWQSKRYVLWKVNVLYAGIYGAIGVSSALALRFCMDKLMGFASPLQHLMVGLSAYMIIYGLVVYLSMRKRLFRLLTF